MKDNLTEIQEIIQGICEFKVIPFFGSGMSSKFGIKTWEKLIELLKTELNSTTTDYLDVAQEYQDKFGREKLIETIKSETGQTDFKDEDLGVHYEVLAMNPPIIYTTNWDVAIETAANKIKRNYFKISSLSDITEAPHYSNIIVKFHGDFESPENIVFSRSDYQNRLSIQHPLDILFRTHILGKKVLFLGYSFSDENIDFIFNKHKELYGTALLPKSYIIAFKNKFNQARADELALKNITTLVLESPTELEELIRNINKSVFQKDIERQTKNIFKSHPLQVLLKSDLENLKIYLSDPSHTDPQKADKYREVLELKHLSDELEIQVKDFVIELIKSDTSLELKQAMVHSFHHIGFRKTENAFLVATELINFTKYDELNYNLATMSMTDVLSEIESQLTPTPTCLAIFLFLFAAIENKEQLTEKQLRRIFEMLNSCDWESIGEISEMFDKKLQQEILQHYTRQFPSLQRELNNHSFLGKRRTRSQLMKEMEDLLSRNMKGLSDDF
ncbi:MAG: SIR2 family protein [Bacteroidota bacterium]